MHFTFPDLNSLVTVGLHHWITSLHIPTNQPYIHTEHPIRTQELKSTKYLNLYYASYNNNIFIHLSKSLVAAQLICDIFATTARKPS